MSKERSGNSRRGSMTSDREIAFAVRTGQLVTFHPAVGEPVTGYVCGMDDFHWKAIVPSDNSVHLIHKSAPVVRVHPEPTYDQETNKDDLEKVVSAFRAWVMRTFFQQAEEPRTRSRHLTSASTGEVKSA